MHILVISPTPTFPADQGNRQRVRNVCKTLQSRGAKIHFGYFPREWGGRFSLAEHSAMTKEWDFFDTIVPSKSFVYQTSGRHFEIDDWWDDAIGRFVNYKCSGMRFDACIVNYAFLSKAFDFLPRNVLRILDTHDRLSGRREMLERNGVVPEFFYTSEAQEKIALERSDLVLAINPDEAAFFRSISKKPVITLGHIAPRQKAPKQKNAAARAQRIGFLGSSNSVNVKNINDFLAALGKIAPEGLPGVEFHFYGSCCPRLNVPVGVEHYVTLHGRIEDLKDFYAAVDCVVVPFLFGTGQKIKLIEALSFNMPLIATANASEGSGSTAPMHVLQSFSQVVEAIQNFGADKQFRDQLQADTEREFAKYETIVASAIDAVFKIADVNSVQLSIDRSLVAKLFTNKSTIETVEAATRIVSTLDMLDLAGSLVGKDVATQALMDGIADAKKGRSKSPLSPRSQTRSPSATQILLAGLDMRSTAQSSKIQLRVHLPETQDWTPDPADDALDIYVDCLPQGAAPAPGSALEAEIIRTPGHPRETKTVVRLEQVVMLLDDLDSTDVPSLAAEIAGEVQLRTPRSFAIHFIDRQGRRGRWNGKAIEREICGEDTLATIAAARAVVLDKPSVILLLGARQIAANSLHRILIADGGPLISLVADRVATVDGELAARSAREAALWITNCLIAPDWANAVKKIQSASVSAIENQNLVANRLLAAISGLKSKYIADHVAALAAREKPAAQT